MKIKIEATVTTVPITTASAVAATDDDPVVVTSIEIRTAIEQGKITADPDSVAGTSQDEDTAVLVVLAAETKVDISQRTIMTANEIALLTVTVTATATET